MPEDIKLTIEKEGVREEYHDGLFIDLVVMDPLELQPGQRVAVDRSLFYNGRVGKQAFPSLGRYRIEARVYYQTQQPPATGAIEVMVVEPGEKDLALRDRLGSEGELVRLFTVGVTRYCRGSEEARCVQELKDAAFHQPESSYAPTIAWLLASALNWKGLSVEPRENLREQVLNDFIERWPDHALAPGVLASLVQIATRSGNSEKADRLKREFASKYPNRRSVISSFTDTKE